MRISLHWPPLSAILSVGYNFKRSVVWPCRPDSNNKEEGSMTTPEVGVLKEMLQGAWWVMLLRGILAIILGLFAFFKPACMIIGLVQLMGLFFLLDGVLLILGA